MSKQFREIEEFPSRIFVVGDVHACDDELQCLLERLEGPEGLSDDDLLVFVGDYIDRGPDARGVIERLLELKERFPKTSFLKGNHEDMLLNFFGFEGLMGTSYLINGGMETLASYGCSPTDAPEICVEKVPVQHLDFFRSLERMLIVGDFIIVHAGLNPLRDITGQLDEDLFWIRDEFISNIHFFEKLVVFGHTPYQDVMLHHPYKIGIDTGLVYGNMLTCIELVEGKVLQVDRCGKRVKQKMVKVNKAKWSATPFSKENVLEG